MTDLGREILLAEIRAKIPSRREVRARARMLQAEWIRERRARAATQVLLDRVERRARRMLHEWREPAMRWPKPPEPAVQVKRMLELARRAA